MYFAKVENTVCENIAVFDDAETAAEFGYTVELKDSDRVSIGDIYDGEKWEAVERVSYDDLEIPGVLESTNDNTLFYELSQAIADGVNSALGV